VPINQPFSYRALPPAVRALVTANLAFFLLQMLTGARLTAWFGLAPARVLQDLWLWQIGTYMFLHAGFFHLLLNMYVLWTFGREIELQWGSLPFLWYYLVCGWGAAVFNILFSPTGTAPSVGASGAIYGVLVAFAVMFPQTIVYLYFFIPLRVRQLVLLFAGIEFLAGFSGSSSGVANIAHLGGMLTGYLYLKSGTVRWRAGRLWSGLTSRARAAFGSRREAPRFHDLNAEVDRILDKILKQGVQSLTREEQELMRRYSKTKK
jgi:membrane associated rhomboid family serine protease